MNIIREGGNAIADSNPVLKADIKGVVKQAKAYLPKPVARGLQIDIGSAGYKVQSGDIDLFVEAQDVVDFFQTAQAKDPVKDAKQLLKKHFEQQGLPSVVSGRNVHIGVPYTTADGKPGLAQVDVMVIHDAAVVAPWHQHGPRGAYDDPDFKGSELFILLNSLAKFKNLKFDAFGANLMNRDTNQVVGRTRKQVAKILLNPQAKEKDLDSVKSIMAALANDPDREGKLAQARQDAARGTLRLPETAYVGTPAWFRSVAGRLQ
jgi:hypothetical protein